MNNFQTKQREISLDVAKGMCILLMVMGHAGCPEWFRRFSYFFHMPVFFFISGMLLSDRYLDDQRTGIVKKLKGYYWPFLKWTVIFILLHNAFVSLHVINVETYGWRDLLERLLRTVTMTGGEQLLGGYWFLISLTWASIGSIVVLGFLKRHGWISGKIMGGAILTSLVIASTESLLPFALPAQFRCQTFLALAFFMSGYVYKKKIARGGNVSRKIACARLLGLLAVLGVSFYWHSDMGEAKTLSWLYYLVALCGTLGFLQLARMLQHRGLIRLFNYIGNKTLYILTFHFLCFKPVSLAWVAMHHLPLHRLADFPVLHDTNSWIWIPYTLFSTAASLAICEAKVKIKEMLGG